MHLLSFTHCKYLLHINFNCCSIRKKREGDREAVLAALICRIFHDHTMVFVQTKKQAHRLRILLGLLGAKVSKSSIIV